MLNMKHMQNLKLKSVVDRQGNQIQHYVHRIDDMKQYSWKDCLEIHGILVINYQNTDEVVTMVGNLAKVSVKSEDIYIYQ